MCHYDNLKASKCKLDTLFSLDGCLWMAYSIAWPFGIHLHIQHIYIGDKIKKQKLIEHKIMQKHTKPKRNGQTGGKNLK